MDTVAALVIAAAAHGSTTRPAIEILENDPAFCSGYRPGEGCSGPDFSLGVYLTVLCRDQVPFVDRSTLADSLRGDAAYQAVFGSNPYLDACTAWDVPAAAAVMGEPVTGRCAGADLHRPVRPTQSDAGRGGGSKQTLSRVRG